MLSCEQDIFYFTIIPGYLHLEDVRALFLFHIGCSINGYIGTETGYLRSFL